MKYKFSIIFILSMLLFSCENETLVTKNHLITVITSDSVKYWDVVYEDKLFKINESKIFPYYYYSFNKDGKYFFYYKNGAKRVRVVGSDMVKSNDWKYISDSTIEVNGELAQIFYLSEDTLKYKKQNDKSIIVLSKSKYQISSIDTIEIAPDSYSTPTRADMKR